MQRQRLRDAVPFVDDIGRDATAILRRTREPECVLKLYVSRPCLPAKPNKMSSALMSAENVRVDAEVLVRHSDGVRYPAKIVSIDGEGDDTTVLIHWRG